MLGIVEATFGGQQGYLQNIVKQSLKLNSNSGLEYETTKMREFKLRNKRMDDLRWLEMYNR